MNAFEEQRNRQIIPRWLPFWTSCQLTNPDANDYSSLSRIITPAELDKKERLWSASGSHWHAIDLVATAFAVGLADNPSVRDAASSLLESDEELPAIVVSACDHILHPEAESVSVAVTQTDSDLQRLRAAIAGLKAAATQSGPNAFLQLDLAYYYTLLAQETQARSHLRVALAYGRGHPLLLKAAARFYLHWDRDPEASLALLRKSHLTASDPTLLSAEIAIAEAFDLRSQLKSTAKRCLAARAHHPSRLSELAGTVGTFEAKAGAGKNARRAFKLACESPTENALAQVVWAAHAFGLRVAPVRRCAAPFPFEADAIKSFWDGRYLQACDAAERWARLQPFASHPSAFASFVAGVSLEDQERALGAARRGLMASPRDFVLNNNIAFSLALADMPEAAMREAERARELAATPDELAVADATRGLAAFRSGDPAAGRELYRTTIDHFRSTGDDPRLALASVFYAREECRAGSDLYPSAREAALRAAERVGLRGVLALQQLRETLPGGALAPLPRVP